MSFLPSGYVETTLIFTQGASDPMNVVLGWDNQAEDLSASDAALSVVDAFDTNMIPVLSSAVVFQGVRAITGDGGESYQGSGASGGLADAGLPPNNTALIRKISGVTGRHNRGRAYIPGVPETQVNASGVLDSDWRLDLSVAWQGFMDDVAATGGMTPVILHATALAPTEVTGFSTDAKVATQRRRLR